MMKLIDGRQLAKTILTDVSAMVAQTEERGILTTLVIVTATRDESSEWYVSTIDKKAKIIGIDCQVVRLDPNASQEVIADKIRLLADDKKIHGIILQTPLPPYVDADDLRSMIPIDKDVDGANPLSAGRATSGLPSFSPATAVAVMELLRANSVFLPGSRAVVVGRSRIVGMPVAHLLLDADSTVTICHSKTKDLVEITKQADVLVVAIGQPRFITSEFVKPGAVVIDVGTNVASDGNLIGDIDAESVGDKPAMLTPVPGGVGPVTTAILLKHTAIAAQSLF